MPPPVVVEHRYVIVREAGQLGVASAGLFEPPLEPQVKDVVQVNIRKHGADGTTLQYAAFTQEVL